MTGPWRIDSLIEDFEITIAMRNLGWDVRACQAHAHTSIPDTLRALWRQRIRWGRGGVDECRRYGWTPGTRRSIFAYGVYGGCAFARLLCILIILISIAMGFGWHFAIWGLIPLGLGWVDRMQSMWRLPDRTWRDVLLSALLIPEDLYGLMLEVCTARAIWLSLTNKEGAW